MSILLLFAIILYAVCATWSFANSEKKDAAALISALRLDALRGQTQSQPQTLRSGAWNDGNFVSEVVQYMSRFSLIDCEDCCYGEKNDEGFFVIWLEFAPKNDTTSAGIFEKRMKSLIKRWVSFNYNGFDTPVYSYPLPDRLYKGYAFATSQEQAVKLDDWKKKRVAWERAESARTKPPMETKKSV